VIIVILFVEGKTITTSKGTCSDGSYTIMIVKRNDLAEMAVAVGMDIDDTGSCFLKTTLPSASFASHNDLIILQIYFMYTSRKRNQSLKNFSSTQPTNFN